MARGTERRKATASITLRLTPEERQAVDEAAAREGVGPSSYARAAVLQKARQPLAPSRAKRDGLRVAVGHWTSAAVNIKSDLDKLAAGHHGGTAADAAALAAVLAQLEALHREVVAATGAGAE